MFRKDTRTRELVLLVHLLVHSCTELRPVDKLESHEWRGIEKQYVVWKLSPLIYNI
jgi:hypothetical protein